MADLTIPYEIKALLETLIERLDELAPKEGYRAQSIITKDIYEALSKAQGEYLEVRKDSAQSASLHAIMKAVRQALAKNGLSLTQMLQDDSDGEKRLITRLGHSSGQWIESLVKIRPLKNDKNQEQSNEATINFMKKTTAKAILGITVPNDLMDDDADCLSQEPDLSDLDEVFSDPKKPAKKSEVYLSNEQYEDLNHEIADYPEIGEALLKKLGITSLSNMKRSDYRKTIDEVRRIKLKYQKARGNN